MVSWEMSDSVRLRKLSNAADIWRQKNAEIIKLLHEEKTPRQIADALKISVQKILAIRLQLKDTGELS